MENGCGTGYNLKGLAKAFPQAELVGADLSAEMLNRARKNLASFGDRVRFHQGDFAEMNVGAGFDLVVLAYTLTMTHPHSQRLIERATAVMTPRGQMGVVDFHDSVSDAYKRWMGVNHVRMEGELPEYFLRAGLKGEPRFYKAYGGLWRYLRYIGQRVAR